MAKGNPVVRLTAETNDYERKMRQANKTFNDFMKGIGLSPAKFSAMTMALGAVSTALKVAKDAFASSEAAVDEWGRVMDSAKSLYQGFLYSLNNSDISGFLGRIDQIVTAARTAYNELDRLGTLRTIQKPEISAQQTENERIRMMIQTGRYIAPIDGRKATPGLKNGQLLSADQIRTLEKQLKGGMDKLVGLVGNEVQQTTKAIDAVYVKQATELGMSIKEFRRGTSSMAEFEKRVAGAENYTRWQQEHSYVDINTGRTIAPRTGNPYAQYKGWDVFRVDGEKFNRLVDLIAQRDQQAASAYSMQSQAYRTMNRAEGITTRKIMGGGGGGGGKGGKNTTSPAEVIDYASDSIVAQEKLVNALREQWRKASADLRDGYAAELKKAEQILSDMQNPGQAAMRSVSLKDRQAVQDIFAGATANFATSPLGGSMKLTSPYARLTAELETLKQKQMESLSTDEWERYGVAIDNVQAKLDKLTGKTKLTIAEQWGEAANAIQSVGGALQTIEDPAAKVLGIIAQAIATIALTFAKSLEKTFTPWDWIAAAAAGTATMISTISAIKSATAGSYAQGGVIPGNHYSGDMQLAAVNSGEVILNRAQVGNLASALGDGGGTPATPYTTGEQIFLGLTNYLKRTGKGEIVTTKR